MGHKLLICDNQHGFLKSNTRLQALNGRNSADMLPVISQDLKTDGMSGSIRRQTP